MQDHQELQMLRLREEMEQAAQKMLFDERTRLAVQFSEERAELEQKLFEERQSRQLLEEELLIWKQTCERKDDDVKASRLQHERDKQVWKQEREQKEREEQVKEEKVLSEKTRKETKNRESLQHAKRQFSRRMAVGLARVGIANRYLKLGSESGAQLVEMVYENRHGTSMAIGDRCAMCWSVVDWNLPFLGRLCPSFTGWK
jgi:hypothetical protein